MFENKSRIIKIRIMSFYKFEMTIMLWKYLLKRWNYDGNDLKVKGEIKWLVIKEEKLETIIKYLKKEIN